MTSLVYLIVFILLLGLLLMVLNWMLSKTTIDSNLRTIILAIAGLLMLLWIISHFGILP